MAVTILVLGLLVFFGHFLAGFFERTKVPDVLVLMLAGMLLGPVFGIVTPADFGKVGPVFTTLALIIILFEGGIHLNVRTLGAAAADTLTVSLSTMAITLLLVAHLADLLLPLDFTSALFVGAVLGGTSSAVVVPLIRVLKLNPGPSTVLFLESAATDILVIVLALGLLQTMTVEAGAGGGGALGGGAMVRQIGASFLVAGLVGAAGALLWSAVLDKVRQVPNTVFTTLAYVFILFGLTELWGYSGAIAALTFGVAVANLSNIPQKFIASIFSFRFTAFQEHERAFFGEAVFLVKTFFFVYLGVSLTFADWRAVATGLVLGVVAFPARAPVVRLLASPATTSRRDAALMTVLVPKGLAAAVMASLPAQAGVPGGEAIQGAVYAAIFFSIVVCALLVFLAERGTMDPLLRPWLGKFPQEIAAAEREPPAPGPQVGAAEPAPPADAGAPPSPAHPPGGN
ncbi:MAG: cation:proton antiporter [Gemmatimonadetes bacterium]|nr:cation:proton antiporter [Gemmatimonadota bacterium]